MKQKILIIAEAGVNHNGNLSNALKMVNIAAKAKADFIKFQTFSPESLSQKNELSFLSENEYFIFRPTKYVKKIFAHT